MTITAKRAHTQISAALTLIERAATRLPDAVHAIHMSARSTPSSPTDGAGIRSKGGVSDPTGSTAAHAADVDLVELGNLEFLLSSLALTADNLIKFVERWAPERPTHPLCDGGPTSAPWSKPQCGEYVRSWQRSNGDWEYSAHRLCTGCERRKQRHDARQIVA